MPRIRTESDVSDFVFELEHKPRFPRLRSLIDETRDAFEDVANFFARLVSRRERDPFTNN